MNLSQMWKSRWIVGMAGFLVGVMIWFAPWIYRTRYRDADEITEITLERKGCYGNCPVYKVVLSKGQDGLGIGSAMYLGIRNVPWVGKYKGGVNFDRLAEWIEKQGFFELKDEYAAGTFDAGVVVTAAVRRGIRKTVTTHNSGAPPLELWGINAAIDGVAWKADWTKVE